MASGVQDCDCGFVDSTDPTQSIFSSFLAVNFSLTTSQQLNKLFIPATYEVDSRGSPYTRNFSADLVQLSDTGLNLSVLPAVSGEVPCAQIFTRAATFSYGSYHALFRASDIPGTVTAFFNYKNDSSEIDIEYLSGWTDPTLLYTVKPQIYLDNGNPDNSTYQREVWNGTAASFHQDFHDWSFVWLPEIVHFGLDANYSRSLTTNVPQAPGRLALSHWSDGNPKYSLGPPSQNSVVTVSSIWTVYNDTNATVLVCKKASSPCTITNGILQNALVSGGNNGSDLMPTSTIIVNSAQSGSSTATPGWLFVLFLLFWLHYWRSV
jgi:beta-glucanase (GH16 family)